MSKLNWIEIDNTGGIFIEIAFVGSVCLMRTYLWDSLVDEPTEHKVKFIDKYEGEQLLNDKYGEVG